MRVADYIVKYLENNNVKNVYGIPAGTVGALYDALEDTNIQLIVTKNEAAATYAATRYASISHKLGVCCFAGGVGLNNAINGIAEASRSKVPVLIISGYVNRWQIGKGAVQELNTEMITAPITKYSKTILKNEEVAYELKKAIKIALTPPYGPVHLSIPIDMQIDVFEGDINSMEPPITEEIEYDNYNLSSACELINNSNTGVIMVGKGARGLKEDIKELSTKLKWPIITTPEGKGVINSDFALNLGNYGFCSSDYAAEFIDNAKVDCLLILGSSLGESATRNFNDVLVEDKKVIHIDWDKNELNRVFKADVAVYHDLHKALPFLLDNVLEKDNDFAKPEVNKPYVCNHTGLSTRLFLEKVVDIVPENTYFISDIGEYMNFIFKYLPLKQTMDFDISLNYGAMGAGVTGVMGAYAANPARPYSVIVGDGSFFMNGIEVLTAKEYRMPIIYFVINNSMLGYVEHGQKFIYGRSSEGFSYERVSIKDMVQALGIKAFQMSTVEELENIKECLMNINEPIVVELVTDGTEKVPVADRFKALSNK
ncbi:thiamine pyrophosphate-binding protein [Clostridium sp.]|uniref:thiamine pyrophosphate-binding protein n=1 Tax=Clostridium sp. TaxID=1506 RepID=UPI00283C11F1|nr:thiamine pyrophosphate-binding protein [Clostridium sp.]MDR3597759.1 thiamine pyrophosphate-binding protein [Clostridium sp.]